MGKSLNKSSMDSLISGLVHDDVPMEEQQPMAIPPESPELSDVGKAKVSEKTERVCTIVDTNDMNKIRAIAANEGLPIKEIIALGLSLVIDKYEELHGKIRVKRQKKGDIGTVFNVKQ